MYAEVCQWVLAAWRRIKTSTIENGFRTCGLLSVAAEAESSDEEMDFDEARQQIIDMLEAALTASKNQMMRMTRTEFFCVSFKLNQTLSKKLGFLTKFLN